MKKKIFAMLLLLCSMMGFAQTQRVASFEGGGYILLGTPVGTYHNGSPELSAAGLGLDFRCNMKNSPWDYGVYMELNVTPWAFKDSYSTTEQRNRTLVFGVASHYNFKQGTLVNPYVGLGLGVGVHDVVSGKTYDVDPYSLAISPRVGVELLRSVRIGAQAHILREGFHSVALTVGFSIGGWRKK